MNTENAEHFRSKLLHLRDNTYRELAAEPDADVQGNDRDGDLGDQANASEERTFGSINKDRKRVLINEIERALTRLDNGTYGYCEDTNDPIPLLRLEAQPTATLTAKAQAARERRQQIEDR